MYFCKLFNENITCMFTTGLGEENGLIPSSFEK